jgi:ribulose-bisphosphate carboxylase large chain
VLSIRTTATYELVARDPDQAAQVLAGEGSTGTFVPVVGEDARHVERFAIVIDELTVTDRAEADGECHARLVVVVPDELSGGDLITLLASVAGNVSEVAQVSSLRLVDLAPSESFAKACPRPHRGVAGIRALLGPEAGVLRGRRLGPACRTGVDALREGIRRALADGAEIVLDPALAADTPALALADRLAAVEPLLDEHRERGGHGAAFLYAIDDEPHAMVAHAESIAAAGGAGAIVGASALGISAVAHLRRRTDLVLAARSAPGVAMSRSRRFGVADRVSQLLWRLAGIDALPVGPGADTLATAVADRLAPMLGDRDRALPVVAEPGAPGVEDILVLNGGAA